MRLSPSRKTVIAVGAGIVLVFICLILVKKWPAREFVLSYLTKGSSSPISHEKSSPNIVVIIMDTVRRDSLSLYGNPRQTTPFVDSLAKISHVFEDAHSTSCWTLPSHASIFTGLHAVSHGATQEHLYLEDDFLTLAEILKEGGYQTVGFSSNPMVGKETNLAQGFDEYYEMWRGGNYKVPAEAVNAKIRHWLQVGRTGQPFFMFINYMEAHRPYFPPDKYKNLYTDKEITPIYNLKLNVSYSAKFTDKVKYDTEDYEVMRALYEAEIKELDDCLGQLFSILTEFHLFEQAAIIVTSDHGENFGEHDLIEHVFGLYETTLRVPLIIRYPPLFDTAASDRRRAQLLDLFPTILAIAGVEADAFPSSGVNLADKRTLPDDRPVFAEYYYPEHSLNVFPEADRNYPALERFKRRLTSIEIDGYKLIVGSDGRNELYEVRNDPEELHNLIDVDKDKAHSLSAALQAYKKEASQVGPRVSRRSEPKFDQESREKLKSLGYMQ